jgi:Rad3-related DNA helicase
MNQALNSGKRCILISAPTGLGKSGINTTFCRTMSSFYTTPQNSLIDQILADKFLSKYFVEIKGRQNYQCIKDYTGDSTVDIGMCTRFKGYIPTHCNHKVECLYYSQKFKAIANTIILTNPMYLILEGKVEDPTPPRLGLRDILIVDEAHFIGDQIVQTSVLEIKPWLLSNLRIPEIKTKADLGDFILSALKTADNLFEQIDIQLDMDGEISLSDVKTKNALGDMIGKSRIFLENTGEEWIWETKFATIGGVVRPYLRVTPLSAQYFGGRALWYKGKKIVIVSSATLLNPRNFIIESGLSQLFSNDEILYIESPSIFPKENRPIVDMTVGSLSYSSIDKNLEPACIKLNAILDLEPGNVAIHIPSYELVDKIIDTMRHLGSKHWDRFIVHSSKDRNEKLLEWTSKRGYVFFAVAFSEGYDWKGEICDAQVLFKVPYPDINDKRIARMLQLKRWQSYYTRTIVTVIQAYGRAVRSEEDKKRFYVIDSSFWYLIRKNSNIIPDWFKEALPKTVQA